jgi:hypothetical protein
LVETVVVAAEEEDGMVVEEEITLREEGVVQAHSHRLSSILLYPMARMGVPQELHRLHQEEQTLPYGYLHMVQQVEQALLSLGIM